jgi:hypothetical protein
LITVTEVVHQVIISGGQTVTVTERLRETVEITGTETVTVSETVETVAAGAPAIAVVKTPLERVIEVGVAGPQGAQGPQGPPGSGGGGGVTGHDELTNVTSDQHHARIHALYSTSHTGQFDETQHPVIATSDLHPEYLQESVHDALDPHHPQAHDIASHTDTDVTGAQLNTLTDTSNADSLHRHDQYATDADLSGHVAASDPHPVYLTNAEHVAVGDAAPHHAEQHAHPAAGVINHSDLSNVGVNDHHAIMHAHTTLDGSGQITHADINGVGANDHHAQVHGAAQHTFNIGRVYIPFAPVGPTGYSVNF